MKKLLKMLALWFVKISEINLVEPYTLEHLKHMIHSVNADYSKFKYKPFLVQMTAFFDGNGDNSIKLTIPFLLDCINKDDVDKIILNIRSQIEAKDYYTRVISIDNNLEVGLLTNDFKSTLQKFQVLADYESFYDKVEKAKSKVKNSQYFLQVDLLVGTAQFKRKQLPILTAKHNFEGLEIEVEEIKPIENSEGN